ncbi:hypothetical protein E2542_SST22880 [Spatholobus suberectus]|nr:hypothetical protein E2542_SST22880 [Spatholobus suberectus]
MVKATMETQSCLLPWESVLMLEPHRAPPLPRCAKYKEQLTGSLNAAMTFTGSLDAIIAFTLARSLIVALLRFLEVLITRNNTPPWTSLCCY